MASSGHACRMTEMKSQTRKASVLGIGILLLSIGGTTLAALLQGTGARDTQRFGAAVVVTLLGFLLLVWRERSKAQPAPAKAEKPAKPEKKKAEKKADEKPAATDSEDE